ncbi:MAG: biopolymer transporter ExbD [Myxococcota bacterium]
MRLRLRARTAHPADAPHEELNVVPYLDVLMNLIIFVLLSVAGLGAWGVIKATAVAGTPAGSASGDAVLVVRIRPDGYELAAFGGGALPLRDGQLDFEALAAQARRLNEAGASPRVVLAPSPDIPYAVVVATMDALRATSDGKPLFPDVVLDVTR